MELWTVVLRTLFLYLLLVIIFRLMGKREIGELSLLDLIVFIMIGEMAVVAIEKPDKPLFITILPMFLLLFIQLSLSILSLKSQKLRDALDGKPSAIVDQGQINEEEMRKQRYNLDDLLTQLREKDIKNVADVEFAILETTGKLSVFEKDKYNQTNQAINIPFPLIKDGMIQEDQLKRIHRTNLWLRQELRKLGYKDIKNIFYCTIDDNGELFVDMKDDK
ncbi:MAG TPA: DUF421 domain-containing protein [Bacillus bacterium]|nr:DUF421 domain-containing protein [Bacillus sp. (in: firmicutes)]